MIGLKRLRQDGPTPKMTLWGCSASDGQYYPIVFTAKRLLLLRLDGRARYG